MKPGDFEYQVTPDMKRNLAKPNLQGSALTRYLQGKSRELKTKIQTRELEAVAGYFEQMKITIQASEGALAAQKHLDSLEERIELEQETELAELRVKHHQAKAQEQFAPQIQKLERETQLAKLKLEKEITEKREAEEVAFTELEAKKRQLELAVQIQNLERALRSKIEGPNRSPEQELTQRLAQLVKIEENLLAEGVAETEAKKIVEEARRAILAEHRRKGS